MMAVYKQCVAVFKSKSQVMSFIEDMKSIGVDCTQISTPKEARIGCGISAKFSIYNIEKAKSIIKRRGYNSFYGLFLIEKQGNRKTTTRI